jgi:thioredoxin
LKARSFLKSGAGALTGDLSAHWEEIAGEGTGSTFARLQSRVTEVPMSIITCPKCGAKNRVAEQALDRLQPVCGKCGTKLNASASASVAGAHPVEVTDESFASEVLGAGSTPVLLDCWAPWCGPCRLIGPVMEQLAAESAGRYKIAKINTDENPRVSQQFEIDAIPTMLLFKSGQLVDRIVGLQPKEKIERKLMAWVEK